MVLMVTGDLMIATESCGAGLTERGSEVGVGAFISLTVTDGVSTWTSTYSSGGSGGGSGSSSGCSSSICSSSLVSAISTSMVSCGCEVTSVTTMSTITAMVGRTTARMGAARRLSSTRASLYSAELFGFVRPLSMSEKRLKNPFSSKAALISSLCSSKSSSALSGASSSTTSSSSYSAIGRFLLKGQSVKMLTLKSLYL